MIKGLQENPIWSVQLVETHLIITLKQTKRTFDSALCQGHLSFANYGGFVQRGFSVCWDIQFSTVLYGHNELYLHSCLLDGYDHLRLTDKDRELTC